MTLFSGNLVTYLNHPKVLKSDEWGDEHSHIMLPNVVKGILNLTLFKDSGSDLTFEALSENEEVSFSICFKKAEVQYIKDLISLLESLYEVKKREYF